MPVVEAANLIHEYGSRRALDDVTFDVGEAEIIALLGPNGGGKTTLFRILSTAMPPTGGSARVFGFDVTTEAADVRRQIGIVFQSPSLDIKLTVKENLYHQGHLYGIRGSALTSRIDDAMERLRVQDRSRELVETLSGGLRRRVELAKGLLHRPRLLILDEPSVGLDPGARYDLMRYLEQLREADVTILLTTHLVEEAEGADRVIILSEGRIVAEGAPDTLKQQIRGDVIALRSRSADDLRGRIAERFGLEPVVLDGTVRIEKPDGHEFIARLIEAFPGMIDSVTLSKPSLEDVFIDRTGHRLWEDQ